MVLAVVELVLLLIVVVHTGCCCCTLSVAVNAVAAVVVRFLA